MELTESMLSFLHPEELRLRGQFDFQFGGVKRPAHCADEASGGSLTASSGSEALQAF